MRLVEHGGIIVAVVLVAPGPGPERLVARQVKSSNEAAELDPRTLYKRAMELEAMQAQGAALTREQDRWLQSFQATADYRTWKDAVELHGTQVLG